MWHRIPFTISRLRKPVRTTLPYIYKTKISTKHSEKPNDKPSPYHTKRHILIYTHGERAHRRWNKRHISSARGCIVKGEFASRAYLWNRSIALLSRRASRLQISISAQCRGGPGVEMRVWMILLCDSFGGSIEIFGHCLGVRVYHKPEYCITRGSWIEWKLCVCRFWMMK